MKAMWLAARSVSEVMDNAATKVRWRRAAAVMLLLSGAQPAAAVSINVVDQDGVPVSHAVVTLTPAAAEASAPGAAPLVAEMRQQGQAFLPHVISVPRGASVRFPNFDDTQHHVYSFSPAKVFELPLFGGDEPPPVTFDQPGVVAVGCNIHDHMRGFIVVTEAPLHGVTDEAGQVTFDDLQPGAYLLSLWHERASAPPATEAVDLATASAVLHRSLPLSPPPQPVIRGLRNWAQQ